MERKSFKVTSAGGRLHGILEGSTAREALALQTSLMALDLFESVRADATHVMPIEDIYLAVEPSIERLREHLGARVEKVKSWFASVIAVARTMNGAVSMNDAPEDPEATIVISKKYPTGTVHFVLSMHFEQTSPDDDAAGLIYHGRYLYNTLERPRKRHGELLMEALYDRDDEVPEDQRADYLDDVIELAANLRQLDLRLSLSDPHEPEMPS